MVIVLSVLLVWPVVHRALVGATGINPWRFFGFAMYCVPKPRLTLRSYVVQDGERLRLTIKKKSPARQAARRFSYYRKAWGSSFEPDEFARVILDSRPDFPQVDIEVFERRLGRDSGLIIEQRFTYRYVRDEPAGAVAELDSPPPRSGEPDALP